MARRGAARMLRRYASPWDMRSKGEAVKAWHRHHGCLAQTLGASPRSGGRILAFQTVGGAGLVPRIERGDIAFVTIRKTISGISFFARKKDVLWEAVIHDRARIVG